MKRWRGRGIKAIVYIDDGIVASASKERNAQDRDTMVKPYRFTIDVVNVPEPEFKFLPSICMDAEQAAS